MLTSTERKSGRSEYDEHGPANGAGRSSEERSVMSPEKTSLGTETAQFAGKTTIRVRAMFVGDRIDVRTLETPDRLGVSPLVVPAGANGCAAIFKYGTVVFFDVNPVEAASFLSYLRPLVTDPFAKPEEEGVQIVIDGTKDERFDNGTIYLHRPTIERLQTVAYVLAKSVVVAHYEASIAGIFDRIEPMAHDLPRRFSNSSHAKLLLKHIGDTLLIQHNMVGRAEVTDKPELLWDMPDVERLYVRLIEEYELRERHTELDRKLDLIGHTAQTLLDLLQAHRTHRVEWYVVILIVVEIIISLTEMFFLHR